MKHSVRLSLSKPLLVHSPVIKPWHIVTANYWYNIGSTSEMNRASGFRTETHFKTSGFRFVWNKAKIIIIFFDWCQKIQSTEQFFCCFSFLFFFFAPVIKISRTSFSLDLCPFPTGSLRWWLHQLRLQSSVWSRPCCDLHLLIRLFSDQFPVWWRRSRCSVVSSLFPGSELVCGLRSGPRRWWCCHKCRCRPTQTLGRRERKTGLVCDESDHRRWWRIGD